MFFRSTLSNLILSVALTVPFAVAIGACNNAPPAKVAAVQAGDLPEGGEWSGVYFDQTNGYLHLVHEGDTVSGKWRTTAGDAWGEMSGKVTGDLFKYDWKEHRIGMVGPSATRNGRGYFKYTAPKKGEAHEITGEFGLGMDETGMKWHAVKQQNMKPNPASVVPDEVEGHGVGGGWDDNGEGKQPKGDGDKGGGEQKDDDKGGDMPPPID